MPEPQPATLTARFPVTSFGGDVTRLADLNGDGKVEMLVLQTSGTLGLQVNRSRNDLDDVDRALFCLTAVTLDGDVLWQVGTPYDRDIPFTGHGGGRSICVDDVDADGRQEVIAIDHMRILVLDAATGEQKASAPIPADNFVQVYTAQLGDPKAGRQIICKVNGRAYPPWQYSNPTMVFNADLSVYAQPFEVRGAGHNIVAMDVNGDGRDELFIGYSMLDHDCREVWGIDFGPDFDYHKEHADEVAVSDFNGDGQLEVRYSGSEDFRVADLDGNILWEAAAGHSQTSVEGPWGPDGEARIIMSEKNRGLWGLNQAGEVLWNRTDVNGYALTPVRWAGAEGPDSWALFRPQLKPFGSTPYCSDPAWSESLWPSFMDGDGELRHVLPWEDGYAQPRRVIRGRRSYDCGVSYYPIAMDIDGDGLDEIIVHDRDWVWVFHCTV